MARVGADGKAPNRSVSAGAYALGVHFAVQDVSLGRGVLYGGADSEFGLAARALLMETPECDELIPNRYTSEQQAHANDAIRKWAKHLESLRLPSDNAILTSDRGATTRAVIYLDDDCVDRIHGHLEIMRQAVQTQTDVAIYQRIAEQIIRIAGTLQVAEDGIVAGQRVPLNPTYLTPAAKSLTTIGMTRHRIAGASLASDLDEACADIMRTALKWYANGPGGVGKRGYNADEQTWGWAALLQHTKLTAARGRYGQDSSSSSGANRA